MKKKWTKAIAAPLIIGGAGVGMGILGESLGSAGLKAGATTAGGFVSPMVALGGAIITMDMVKDIKPKGKKKFIL